jgi:hypothetical protein
MQLLEKYYLSSMGTEHSKKLNWIFALYSGILWNVKFSKYGEKQNES